MIKKICPFIMKVFQIIDQNFTVIGRFHHKCSLSIIILMCWFELTLNLTTSGMLP